MTKYTIKYTPFLHRLVAPIDNKFALISLLCFISYQAKKKQPKWKVIDTLEKIRPNLWSRNSRDFIELLCQLCDDFMFNQTEFQTFDFKNYNDMIKTINSILDLELPFRTDENDKCPF